MSQKFIPRGKYPTLLTVSDKNVSPAASNISFSFHHRRRATFHENIPMSSSTHGKPDFGEADLTKSSSE
jgi:hypothetical protein